MSNAQSSVDALVEANAYVADALTPLTNQLLASIFGADEVEVPKPAEETQCFQMKVQPIIPQTSPKANFSRIMKFAHDINRRYGHSFTRGCNCGSCEHARKAA